MEARLCKDRTAAISLSGQAVPHCGTLGSPDGTSVLSDQEETDNLFGHLHRPTIAAFSSR